MMDVYVLCRLCDCYCWTKECSQIITEHPDTDYYECFDCQPNVTNTGHQ